MIVVCKCCAVLTDRLAARPLSRQMSIPTDRKVDVLAADTTAAAAAVVSKFLRTHWIERLRPALEQGGLVPELIGLIAEYSATHPLRWSASLRAPRALLAGPLDEDGAVARSKSSRMMPIG
jgi:hypothetical protein